jgi:hypothetical protein
MLHIKFFHDAESKSKEKVEGEFISNAVIYEEALRVHVFDDSCQFIIGKEVPDKYSSIVLFKFKSGTLK